MYMWCWILLFFTLILLNTYAAPPKRDITENLPNAGKQSQWEQKEQKMPDQQEIIEKYKKYLRYLEIAYKILDSTPHWKKALKSMMQEGSQLSEHLGFRNWENLSKEELHKLIFKILIDISELEKQRKANFKVYEMKKKAEEEHLMQAQMSQVEHEKYKQQKKMEQQQHNKHEKLKHPGSRDQFEEAWEDIDKLEKSFYDPKTFFTLHDLDNDGYWNYMELNTVLVSEIEKLYNSSNPDNDLNERLVLLEDLYRMREHVMKQMDKDGDYRISLFEFLADAEAQEERPNEGWEDIGDNEQFTEEEFEIFKKEYAKQQGWGEDAYSASTSTPQYLYSGHQKQVNKVDNLSHASVYHSNDLPLHASDKDSTHVTMHQSLQQQHPMQQIEKTYGV
ncbi:unnamed protein product [Thelazia callipaeda]|uniref:EF-hand domain-containing protein n=1 Tax=Thelazia callipaeda TaxID=103827 RepID=A0A0N5CKH4_THECL|nr:unnamed protein product [Thelazia callipaeda]